MKRPRPTRPSNIPKGTIEFGGPIEWFSIALIVRTEALSPERISELLGCAPTSSFQKDVPIFRPDGSVKCIPRFSSWQVKLSPSDTDEWDPCEAAKLLLLRVNGDLRAWQQISSAARVCLSFGLSMDSSNRGFSLDPELMRYLADRSIEAEFDVYTGDTASGSPLIT